METEEHRAPFGARARSFNRSLAGRLLWLTALFVLFSEILIFVPSISKYRLDWLRERLEAAQIASLALEATPDHMVSAELTRELLGNAEVVAVTLHRDNTRRLVLGMPDYSTPMLFVDVRHLRPLVDVSQALGVFFAAKDRHLNVIGAPRMGGGLLIEMVVPEAALRRDMLLHSRNILGLSLVISIVTASLVYFSLFRMLLRPMQRITGSMVSFQEDPEDPDRIITPADRGDEIGRAEHVLRDMQEQLRAALAQKTRLAALGAGVSKINHDLRNILASAQLVSDRLAQSDDPTVKKLSPKLVRALDRAVALCRDTLNFGALGELNLERKTLDLHDLVEEVGAELPADENGAEFENAVNEGFPVFADRQHMFRILNNLARNAYWALQTCSEQDRPRRISVSATRDAGFVSIDVQDTGPGLGEKARKNLFTPFKGSMRPGGSGLGLALSRELARAHGGDLELVQSSQAGARFRIRLAEPP